MRRFDTSDLSAHMVDLDSDWEDDDEDAEEYPGPLIVHAVEEGPVYAITKCRNRIVYVVNQTVHLLEWPPTNGHVLRPLKTLSIQGDYTEILYTISLSPDFVVAAGAGECLFVWATGTWDLVHTISVSQPKDCGLNTSCVLTTDWNQNEAGALLCGGYDGRLSLWRLAHRLGNEN